MNKHTTGPWTTEHNAPFTWGIYGPDNNWIAQTLPKSDDGSADSPEQVEANARLIAAAPDLLAALKVTVQWGRACIEMTDDKWMHQAIQADIDKCNAAIARAEGGDQ